MKTATKTTVFSGLVLAVMGLMLTFVACAMWAMFFKGK